MGILILFFCLSILFSFLCSVWESVLLSISPGFATRMLTENPAIGKPLQIYKADIDRPLSAILTLNTIAHTVGAIGVGVQAGKLFGNHAINLPYVNITFESLIAAAMTLAILIFSEIIPKTIGANWWKKLAPFTVRSLRIVMAILAPFVWLSKLITGLISKRKGESVLSRADIEAIALAGLQSGAIGQDESSIIQNLIRLQNKKVRNIMTPRSVLLAIDEQMTMADIHKKFKPLQYSRIPVFGTEPDNITGLILKDSILQNLADDNHSLKAEEIKREIRFVDDDLPVSKLMDFLVRNRIHMAMVTDNYGSIVGLVSMEDVFETLLGLEIVDETDKVEDLQEYARERWQKRLWSRNRPGTNRKSTD